ncbi:hypothetical protein [Mesorhizobium sp. B2-1-3A]|uniref:hypothetical protein n=1 Tax=Mesorhizobium sp. B2-1-3A TaxID=2589971 RepID=UPI00112D1A5F|nr:hypothetical protein [Mesorhizobium sp. B2-1-3A]TPM89830.1 hypothetical protein FJ977_35195 [Mesorhizobium sp. B2-1-3A]
MGFAIKRPATAFSLDKSSKATKSFKDEAHLAFIRKLPSVISGVYGCDPAHISAGSPIHNKKRTGGAQKASDCWTVPLTRAEHDAQHDHGDELAWWKLQGIDPFELAIRLYEISGDLPAGIEAIRSARLSRSAS